MCRRIEALLFSVNILQLKNNIWVYLYIYSRVKATGQFQFQQKKIIFFLPAHQMYLSCGFKQGEEGKIVDHKTFELIRFDLKCTDATLAWTEPRFVMAGVGPCGPQVDAVRDR
jgi:hypothetical protein